MHTNTREAKYGKRSNGTGRGKLQGKNGAYHGTDPENGYYAEGENPVQRKADKMNEVLSTAADETAQGILEYLEEAPMTEGDKAILELAVATLHRQASAFLKQ